MINSDLKLSLKNELASMITDAGRLRNRLTHLDRKIEAARILLAEEDDSRAPPTIGKSFTQTFASQVRAALASVHGIASPTQVAQALVESGFQANGKTDLVTTVNSELYRMAKSAKSPVTRVRKGRYHLKEK